ncbi:MAG TPA: iron-containing alcohol dehydrogenase, partial [Rectinemataceae bacterium]
LPPALTAATGADALTHAVEAYTNTLHYSDVDAQAIEAVRLVFANLPKACAQGSDIGAREAMLRASHLAGRAFTRGFVGYVHAVAHRFGERYHVPHGLANAIVLPYFLDRYIEACPERLADLYRAANLHSSTPVTGVAPGAASAGAQTEARATALAEARGFVEGVKSLFASVGLPPKAQFLQRSDIPGIAADALKEAHGTPYPVPLVMNAPELSALIETMAPDT